MLNRTDQDRIEAAITSAETRTNGEIFCVLARDVSRYREVPLAWATGAALLLPPLAVLLGLHRLALADIFSSWTDETVRAVEGLIVRALSTYALLQAGIFICVALIVSVPSVRKAMTPGVLRRHRVRQAARRHFVAAGAKLSHAEPHILIYASLADRRGWVGGGCGLHRALGGRAGDA